MQDTKNFLLIGAAGYIAPRHMEAIDAVGGRIVAAYDPNDSVGILDSYSSETKFFTNFELFQEFAYDFLSAGERIDYVSITSPNYMHAAHCAFGMRLGADVICEKPLVLKFEDFIRLEKLEKKYKQRVFNILQLRIHPSIIELKNWVDEQSKDQPFSVELNYVTSRGDWYNNSWKANNDLSGGVAFNIGIHFFDMLLWIFGPVVSSETENLQSNSLSGKLELSRAEVKWFLSTDIDDVPLALRKKGQRTYRSIKIQGRELEFSLKVLLNYIN